jgi:hypothetical protein
MKKSFLGLVLAVTVSLLIPMSASAAQYETFVGCDDLAENPVPSHVCQISDFPAAYFASDVNAEYEVCVEFPTGTTLCAEEQLAKAGFLYINSISTELAGDYFASWYVEGVEVGSWAFRLDSPPPPPVPPLPAAAAPSPPAVAPGPSPACLKARQLVTKASKQLKNAAGPKQKAKIRAKLKKAKATAKHLC